MQFAQLGDILEVLFFVAIIVVTLVIRAIKGVGERSRPTASEKEGDEVWAWNPAEGETQLREWHPDGQDFELVQNPVQNSAPAASGPPDTHREPQQERPQMNQQNASTPKPQAEWSDSWEGTEIGAYDYNESPHQEATKAMEKAMAVAFPRAKRMLKDSSPGNASKRYIHLNVKGRKDLRRAVLFKEALGQPRAFDL